LHLKRAPDIVSSAGALSEFADAKNVVESLVESREKTFR
jgi:hypothetical protein